MTEKPRQAVGNAADPQQVHRAQTDENFKASRYKRDLAEMLASESGRRVLWDVLARCGVYRLSFCSDAAGTAFNEGRRSIGLELIDEIIRANRMAWMEMQSQNADLPD